MTRETFPRYYYCDICPFETTDPMARYGHEQCAPSGGWLGRGETHRMITRPIDDTYRVTSPDGTVRTASAREYGKR